MDDVFSRVCENLVGRLHGPLSFRLILQPVMATIFALRDGVRDAQYGEPAYFWSLFTDSGHRSDRIRGGWKSISRVFILAVIMDIIYQVIVLHTIYPGEALIVAIVLAILPYLVFRGPINRLVRRRALGRLLSKPMH